MRIFLFTLFFIFSSLSNGYSLERLDVELRIFKFSPNMIPCIDGDPSDWEIVPDDYCIGLDQVQDDVSNTKTDPKDKDFKLRVGWVKGMNQLFFLYESYDDYWRISDNDLINDIFEIVVDGDLDGSPLVKQLQSDHFTIHGVKAQNYHIFTPPGKKDWAFVWGCARWAKRLPYANSACSYTFKNGESGKLVFEFWITPFDYASPEGPEKSVISKFEENKIIGLTFGISDYDAVLDPAKPFGNNYDAQYNLSHKKTWFVNGSDCCAFRLMPLKKRFREPIKAFADFVIVDMDKIVAFKDLSYGNITRWTWDFGNGVISHEQNPVHHFDSSGGKPVTLTVEGPDGISMFPFVYEELFLK